MADAINIRRALVADTETVHSVLVAATDEIPLTDKFDTDPYKKWVRDHCKAREVWLAFAGGELAGIMVMDVIEIFYLVTRKEFRRRGVARALVHHGIDHIKRKYSGSGGKLKVKGENAAMIAFLNRERFLPHPVLFAQEGWKVYHFGDVP